MQWIDLGNVILAEGSPVVGPPGASVLVDADVGGMLVIAPREGYEDLVMGFTLVDFTTAEQAPGAAGGSATQFTTDWVFRSSFPVFVLNTIRYFGRSLYGLSEGNVRAGQPVALRVPASRGELTVRTPDGRVVDLKPVRPGEFSFTATDALGVYRVEAGGQLVDQFAVNLFDARESDIRLPEHPTLKIGYVDVPGEHGWKPARRELWKLLLLLGLVVLLGEWYIYNRRISL